MIQIFKENIASQHLFKPSDKVLLAVSGGMDSVSMCHLFAKAGFSFGIAHCNFKLRAAASEADAAFVETLAKELQVEYFVTAFDTESLAKSAKVSIQMAARDLRYEWLEKVRQAQGFDYIATAHHLNDSIETVIYNFAKGCGIRGLHGILPKKEFIIRPLLFAKRTQIENFIQDNHFAYREDASNASDKYSRNFIRHQIVPKLKSLNPAFEKSADETIDRLRETEFLFKQSIQFYKEQIVEERGEECLIDYAKIPKEAAQTLLYEWLRPMGFNGDQISMLVNQNHQSGIRFSTSSHTLLVDRNRYIIRKNEVTNLIEQDITINQSALAFNQRNLHFEILERKPSSIPKVASIALLDFEQLTFPLQIRPWRAGDIFQPFGMKGKHQKVQDFLTHKKLNRFEKAAVHVLESNGRICWVVGMRIDERFKLTEQTKQFYKITLED